MDDPEHPRNDLVDEILAAVVAIAGVVKRPDISRRLVDRVEFDVMIKEVTNPSPERVPDPNAWRIAIRHYRHY